SSVARTSGRVPDDRTGRERTTGRGTEPVRPHACPARGGARRRTVPRADRGVHAGAPPTGAPAAVDAGAAADTHAPNDAHAAAHAHAAADARAAADGGG